MSWLLDANVVSEFARPKPSEKVIDWFKQQAKDSLFTSAVVLAEISYGIGSTPDVERQAYLTAWLEDEIRPLFADRILQVDEDVARAAIAVLKAGPSAMQTFSAMDLLIAATAKVYGLTVVTRNARDFSAMGAELLNPWLD